jgi:hypothetical protein
MTMLPVTLGAGHGVAVAAGAEVAAAGVGVGAEVAAAGVGAGVAGTGLGVAAEEQPASTSTRAIPAAARGKRWNIEPLLL